MLSIGTLSDRNDFMYDQETSDCIIPRFIEKTVIIHKDENGFGLRLKGQAPVLVEHVHEHGAAWRAGVRSLDTLSKVNGVSVTNMDHKDVVLMFKNRTRFIVLTLLSPAITPCFETDENFHAAIQAASRVSSGMTEYQPFERGFQNITQEDTDGTSCEPLDPSDKIETYPRLLQSSSSSSLPVGAARLDPNLGKMSLSRQPTTNKRLEIIREFIDTEKTHTERLKCLDELFYIPLKTDGFMTSEQLRQIFSCHRTLYKIHRQIYRILLSANYSLYTEPMFGSALLEIFEGDLRKRLERAACTFCSAQSTNADLLNKLTRRDTKAGEFIAQVTSQQTIGRLGIKDLLASCFQRLTKYPLLLENLYKATPEPPTDEVKSINSSGLSLINEGKENKQMLDKDEMNTRRMLAISLAEEREFIERALRQSRQILVKVNEAIRFAISHNKLKEIWKRTDKYPGVPLIDITKQQLLHEGLLTLRLAKRSFDVYVLLLNDYLIILTREGQDKYRLKFFTPDGKSSSSSQFQSIYSPVFVIDEHLATRDAATDENGFYLLCKRKDDSRIYEFSSRSPSERMKWRDRIQSSIDRQISKGDRRSSYTSTNKSSSELSTKRDCDDSSLCMSEDIGSGQPAAGTNTDDAGLAEKGKDSKNEDGDPIKIAGTISYVEEDEIVTPSRLESSRALVEHAIHVRVFDNTTTREPGVTS